MTPIPDSGYDMTPAGMVKIQVGDVLNMQGGLHICTRSVESCAVMEPLSKVRRTVRDQVMGTEATFETYGTKQRISQTTEPGMIVERRGQAGVDEYLGLKKNKNMQLEPGEHIAILGARHIVAHTEAGAARLLNLETMGTVCVERDVNDFYLLDKPRLDERQRADALETVLDNFSKLPGRSREDLTNSLTGEEKENTMALRKLKGETKRKQRGGLAAEAMAGTGTKAKMPKAAKSDAGTKGKRGLDELFGHSVSSFVKRLSKEGYTVAQAEAILTKRKATFTHGSVTTAISDGKSEKYGKNAADLTREQLAEIKAQAPAAETTKE